MCPGREGFGPARCESLGGTTLRRDRDAVRSDRGGRAFDRGAGSSPPFPASSTRCCARWNRGDRVVRAAPREFPEARPGSREDVREPKFGNSSAMAILWAGAGQHKTPLEMIENRRACRDQCRRGHRLQTHGQGQHQPLFVDGAASSITSWTASPPRQLSRRRWPATWMRGTAGLGEKAAERCLRGAERDRRQPRAVERIGQRAAQMAVADRLGIGDAHGRKEQSAAPDWRRRTAPAFRCGRSAPIGAAATDSAPSIASSGTEISRSSPSPSRSTRNSRKASTFSAATVKPAAIAWPPPFSNSPAWRAAITAGPSGTPGTERPEPRPIPSPTATTQAGRS